MIFLAEEDLQELKPFILDRYFYEVDLKCIKSNDGEILGFCGVHDENIEMLFISPDVHGNGVGALLTAYAIENQRAT